MFLRSLAPAANLLDIELSDHVVIGRDGAVALVAGAGRVSGVEIGESMEEFDFATSGTGSINASTLYVNASTGTHSVTWTLMVI